MAPISPIQSFEISTSFPTITDPSLRNFIPRTLKELTKRYNSCPYYSTSCSRHRTIIIIIIVFVVLLMILILFLLFRRNQKMRELRQQDALRVVEQARRNGAAVSQNPDVEARAKREETMPPPPYEEAMPRKPESALSPEIHRVV
jgi:preprotein translocase subunit YajC